MSLRNIRILPLRDKITLIKDRIYIKGSTTKGGNVTICDNNENIVDKR